MGLTAVIIAAVGCISAILGVLNILEIPSEPIFSDKLNWMFWLMLSAILLLISIVFLLGRKPGGYED
jgi:hypothetical protein